MNRSKENKRIPELWRECWSGSMILLTRLRIRNCVLNLNIYKCACSSHEV